MFTALVSRLASGKVTSTLESLDLTQLHSLAGAAVGDPQQTSGRQDQLNDDELLIEVRWSSLNYKDALGITGKVKIFKSWPMIGGIDLAGIVTSNNSTEFLPGDEVLVTGCGLGESHFGGFSRLAKVPSRWVIRKPTGLSLRECMIYGTAGFTAGLCLWRLRQNDQVPQLGPMLVTGASGGVGSFAVSLLAAQGFEVWALTGKPDSHSYLKSLGAHRVLAAADLNLGSRPLESVRFGGVIDNLGGANLAGLLRHVQLWGNVACVGLAQGAEFASTVMPHILRGVSLLGISSANTAHGVRHQIWRHLDTDWRSAHLEQILTRTITLNQLLETAQQLLERKIQGRILVQIDP